MLQPYRRIRALAAGFAFLIAPTAPAWAQQAAPISIHTVYLIGNTAAVPLTEIRAAALRQVLQATAGPLTLVHLGDVVANDGLPKKPDVILTARLDALVGLVTGLPNARLVVVPGDKDWANAGKEGLKAVRRLGEYLDAKLNIEGKGKARVLLPGGGCPGPDILDLAPNVRLVAVNSAWFTHPYDRPEEPDTDCKTLSKEEFDEQLDDALSDRGRRNVLLVGHHPAVSEGIYGGRVPLKRHLFPFENMPVPLPVFGSIYAAYRQNVGTPRDLAFPAYTAYAKTIRNALRDHPGVVYASAHDFSLQLQPLAAGFQLVSGSLTQHQFVGHNGRALYNRPEEGFAKLEYSPDGTVRASFLTFPEDDGGKSIAAPTVAFATTLLRAPCASAPADSPGALANEAFPCGNTAPTQSALTIKDAPAPGTASTTVVPGPEYKAGFWGRTLIGPVYRRDWTTAVQAPTLNLAESHGGLHAFGRGGGRQTTSLKLVGGDSLEYVFRSINKDLQGALPPELRNTVIADVLRDVTATSQPYSGLICSELLDATDILHARPQLYRLPDDPAHLGVFRPEFAGLFGTLEDRPQDAERGNQKGFAESDDVTRSFGLFRKLYKDHDTHVDAPALARARAFDMLVADFGKHEDNFRWAGYEGPGKTLIYKPIPRDRDQSFTLWNGALTWTANREWAVPSIEDFGPRIHGLESLNWPARHLDRMLLQSVTREQWAEAAKYLQTQLTPAVIDRAANRLPPELRATTGADISRKLRTRLADLPRALDGYYLMLARRVDVVGSNKAEVFQIERLASGEVRVRVFDKAKDTNQPDGPALYDRTFKRGETHEIDLYALAGKDVVQLTGTAPRSILVRVIGGEGQDVIVDESRVSGLRRYTKVYDARTDGADLTPGPDTNDNRADRLGINRYDRRGFEYDGYTPLLNVLYNTNDGYGIGAGFSFDKQGWRKPGFKAQYGIYGQLTSEGNRQASAFVRYRHIIGQWDFAALAEYGDYYPFYNFFGLGNNTDKDNDRYNRSFYRARFSGPRAELNLERVLLRSKSRFRAGVLLEDFTTNTPAGTVLATDSDLPAAVRDVSTANQRLLGGRAELDFDFRDRAFFARRGIRFFARHTSYQQLSGTGGDNGHLFHTTEGFAAYYGTVRVGLPVTLVLKGGGAKTYGAPDSAIPFYKLPQLGQAQNLRGYVRNRFTGDAVAYFNTELRLALGSVKSNVVPFSYGILGFYDVGRVYVRGASPGDLKAGYGGGVYVSPFVDRFALSILYGSSKEESGLIQFAAGFRIDQ